MSKSKNILFLMSGSIAVEKALQLIAKFKKNGFTLRIACTESTFKFVSKQKLETMTGFPIIHKNFQNELDMEHINLGRWADLTLLCPATANTINSLARGSGDNIVGTLFLAYELNKKPFLVLPAMNTQMYNHPSTQNAIKTLLSWGVSVLPTDVGALACGEFGEGRLLEPDFVFNFIVQKYFNEKPKKKILITSGATRENIDGVRFITNFSSGKTGAALADRLSLLGHEVTVLKGVSAKPPRYCFDLLTYSSFSDLNQKLQSLLSNQKFDAVVQAAAISDYSVESLSQDGHTIDIDCDKKIQSGSSLTIQLKPNFKIIERLKDYSCNKSITIVAFKLTKTKNPDQQLLAVNKILAHDDIDFVVQNDLHDILQENHYFQVYNRSKTKKVQKNVFELSEHLNDLFHRSDKKKEL